MTCRLFEILYAMMPLKKWRAFLIAKHLHHCRACQNIYDLEEWIKPHTQQFWKSDTVPHLTAQIMGRIRSPKTRDRGPSRRKLNWVLAGGLCVLILLAIPIWFRVSRGPDRISPTETRQINTNIYIQTIKIKGRNAMSYVFKSKNDENSLFVWAQPSSVEDNHENNI